MCRYSISTKTHTHTHPPPRPHTHIQYIFSNSTVFLKLLSFTENVHNKLRTYIIHILAPLSFVLLNRTVINVT